MCEQASRRTHGSMTARGLAPMLPLAGPLLLALLAPTPGCAGKPRGLAGTATPSQPESRSTTAPAAPFELFPTDFAGLTPRTFLGADLTAIRNRPVLRTLREVVAPLAERADAGVVFVSGSLRGSAEEDPHRDVEDRLSRMAADDVGAVHAVVILRIAGELLVVHNLPAELAYIDPSHGRGHWLRTSEALPVWVVYAEPRAGLAEPDFQPAGPDTALPGSISWDGRSVELVRRWVRGGGSQTVAGVNAIRGDDCAGVVAFNRAVEGVLAHVVASTKRTGVTRDPEAESLPDAAPSTRPG